MAFEIEGSKVRLGEGAGQPLVRHYQKGKTVMLIEDSRVREALERIIVRLTNNPMHQQDLMQECLIRLWLLEREQPGRTTSWYFQHCRFHAQHWLALGRSLDSPKRNHAEKRINIDATDADVKLGDQYTDNRLFDSISTRDLVSTVARRLKPRECRVLHGLAEGFGLREIASACNFSYPTVLKYRRTIAASAVKLGVCPPCGPVKRNADGSAPAKSAQARRISNGSAKRNGNGDPALANGHRPQHPNGTAESESRATL